VSSPLIVAAATPWGHAAIAVVRLSGDGVSAALRKVCGRVPAARRVVHVRFRDAGGVFDDGLVSFHPAPRSYTGEDVAELSCHGNPLLVERLVAACTAAGARLAGPGEFTRRAWRNGRIDLPRAEAVLQALTATSAEGLRVARAGLDGAVSTAAEALRLGLVDVAAELEAILDYPGEDLLFASDQTLATRLRALGDDARGLAGSFPAGRFAVDGATVALVGPVNAGKSTLFNALLGRERALVSPTPGTTRDVVESVLQLPAMRVTLLDTAGDRVAEDPVEAAGVSLGRASAAAADLRLAIVDLRRPDRATVDAVEAPRIVVGTFADLAPAAPAWVDVVTCAPRRDGIAALAAAIPRALRGEAPGGAALVVASQRQRDLFAEVGLAIDAAVHGFVAGPAVVAEQLYVAVGALDALVGRDTREAVLDRLFQRFCVGK
jgi:tRNA modification GTPase